jgi:hypothetical protein
MNRLLAGEAAPIAGQEISLRAGTGAAPAPARSPVRGRAFPSPRTCQALDPTEAARHIKSKKKEQRYG